MDDTHNRSSDRMTLYSHRLYAMKCGLFSFLNGMNEIHPGPSQPSLALAVEVYPILDHQRAALNNLAKAIRYHQEYFMLLGCTEFTKVYLQIKDNPWPYVNLVQITQNARMSDCEVVELLKIANGYLPRVRLEYDRLKEEKRFSEAELNNIARTYQQFVDRNIALKKREDELQLSISELEQPESPVLPPRLSLSCLPSSSALPLPPLKFPEQASKPSLYPSINLSVWKDGPFSG
jgi:hypothetical protein